MAGEFQSLLRVKTEQALAEMRKDLERTIFNESPILNHLEKNMERIDTYTPNSELNPQYAPLPTHGSIVSEAMAERDKAHATRAIEYLDGYFGSLDTEEGITVAWFTRDDEGAETYYVAVKQENRWTVTGWSGKFAVRHLIEKIANLVVSGVSVFFEDRDEAL